MKFTADHLKQALDLQAKSWTQADIAAHLGVDRKTLWRHLTRHNRRVLRRLEGARAALKARQVSQLEWMASEAIRAWEKSKLGYESVKRTEGGRPAGCVSIETTTREQCGDVAYLAEARALMAEMRKILGLDAEGSGITAEDVAKLLDVLARVAGVERHPAILDALNRMLGYSDGSA